MRRILVESLDLSVAGRDLGQIVLGIEAKHLHFTLLVHRVERSRRCRGRRKRRSGEAVQHLAYRDVLTQSLGKPFRRHAERGNHGRVRKAVGISKLRELRVALEQTSDAIVGGHEVQLVGGGVQHALADQRLEGKAAHVGRVEQLGIESGHLPARPLDAIAQGVVELDLGDDLPADLGHRLLVVAGKAAVALDAEEHERGKHEQHQNELQRTGMTAKEIEHRGGRCDKGEPWFAFCGKTRDSSRAPDRNRAARAAADGGC